jgi:thiamine biosynthesis protein ThiI
MSGGVDSPVATYLLMKRGYTPIVTYCDLIPYAGSSNRDKVLATTQQLARFTPNKEIKTYFLPHGLLLGEILKKVPRKITCLLCRKAMLAGAEFVAQLEGAEAIVTGEIIGEQASQTVWNLRAIHGTSKLPLLQPLIGLTKDEVTKIGREIGTLESGGPPADCCSAVPTKPATHATVEQIEEHESELPLENIERIFSGKIDEFRVTPDTIDRIMQGQ